MGAWLHEKYYESSDGDEDGIMRTRAFLAAVRAAQKGRSSEFHDYLRPVMSRIRLYVDPDGIPDIEPIYLQENGQLNDIYVPELQWAYAAFKCLEKIRWEELKNCKLLASVLFTAGGKSRYTAHAGCMTEIKQLQS